MSKENQKEFTAKKRCVVKALLQEKLDPNEIPLEAIHASSVRMMTNFVQHPSPDLANAVIRMLEAIGEHDDSFKTESGYNVYKQASITWRGIVQTMLEMDMAPEQRVVH
ncbi:MAG: hypothetical protein AAF387_01685 [Pseudomonadota bacterium]